MRNWLTAIIRFWQSRDRGKTPQGLSLPAVKNLWQLPIQTDPRPNWQAQEAAVLLSYEQARQRCAVSDHHRCHYWQTLILGADLEAGQLLLDEFFPEPPAEILAGHEPMILHLKDRTGVLELEVRLLRQHRTLEQRAYLAVIINKHFSQGQRKSAKAQFQRSHAPQAQLLLPLIPVLKGHLTELSPSGFTMIVYTQSKPDLLSRTGDCQLRFSEQFQLKATAQVRTLQFHRRPCCHIQVRALFQQLTPEQQDNLNQFVLRCTDIAEEWAA